MSAPFGQRRWDEIQASFDEIVELDASERASRLAVLANTDPELRKALEALLAADAKVSAQLAPLEAVFVSQPSQPDAALDPLGLTGRNISHFEVSEPLGAGGMGVVYRALDTRLGRAVALKFLLPQYNFDDVAKARFLREAHSAAALDHPNLCSIHEVGTSEDGWLFLAMPLYPGETLRARLAHDGPMPIGEALEIARQIAEGLQAAHAAGIVHRDLKPGNVMLLPDGTVKILDFGLAKARDQSLTETGVIVGTVSYMAPEQIVGETVDGRADLWALGVVLYEMLTGRRPFVSEQDIGIAHAILHDDAAFPSTHRADVSAAMEGVMLRLLQKDPARRYSSATDVLRDLARVGTTAVGVRDVLHRRVRRAARVISGRRTQLLPIGAAIVLTGGTAYGVMALRDANPAAIPPRMAIAVLPFRNLSADSSHSYFASGLHEQILSELTKVRAVKVIGRNSVAGYSGPKTPPLKQIARELEVGSLVDASVQVVGNRVRVNVQLVDAQTETPLWVERYDRTLDDAFALQTDIARQVVATVGAALSGDESQALARVPTEKSQAYLLYLQGKEYERRPGRQRENIEAAIRLYQQALALDSTFALAHAALSTNHGTMYWIPYDMTPERLALQQASARAALRFGPNLPEAHAALAGVYAVGPETDVKKGEQETRIALSLAPNDARLWKGLASSHRRQANWEEYEKAFLKAVELDPRDVDFLGDYGAGTHMAMGRYADAIRWFDRVAMLSGDTIWPRMGKFWAYASWKGQMDSVRSLLSGEIGRKIRRDGIIYPLLNLRIIDRQADSVLELLKEAREPVFRGTFEFEPVSLWSAAAHELRGDLAAARLAYDSALAAIDSGMKKMPEDWPLHASRGLALAGLGRRNEALAEVQMVRGNFIYRQDRWIRQHMIMAIARIHARLGDANAAADELDRMMSERHCGLTVHHLRLQPDWDPIRAHPRFQALLTKHANHPNVRS